jgi:hypothetical protein
MEPLLVAVNVDLCGLGDKEKAFDLLNRAFEGGYDLHADYGTPIHNWTICGVVLRDQPRLLSGKLSRFTSSCLGTVLLFVRSGKSFNRDVLLPVAGERKTLTF